MVLDWKIERYFPINAAVAQGVKPSDYQVKVREFDTRSWYLFFFFPFSFFLFFFFHGRWCPLYVCSFFLYICMCSKIITRRLHGGLAAHGHCCCCFYAVTLLSQASSIILFERSEFLIATCKKKKTDRLSVCPDVRIISWF